MLRTLFFVLVILSSASQVFCAENQNSERIRFGYSSISGSRIALWVTSEMGFFSKNGLAAEAIVTPGIQGTQALIAGELQFYLGGVDSAALSVSRGSDLVALATAEPIEYKLIAQPNITLVNELRGKKIVVDRVGGTSYYISLQILEKIGLKTGAVELVQVGGGGSQRVAAFKSGLVAAVVTSPDRFEQLKIPYTRFGRCDGNGHQSHGKRVSYDAKISRPKQGYCTANRKGVGARKAVGQGPEEPPRGSTDLQSVPTELRRFVHGSYVPKERGGFATLSVHQQRRSADFFIVLDGCQSDSARFKTKRVCR